MTSSTGPGMDAFNALTGDEATASLLRCCASDDWAARLASGRPYANADALYSAADSAVATLDDAGLAQALAGHPRIGERAAGPGHETSAREQAGVAGAGANVLEALAAGNAEYERRFGHVYLVCATGRSAEELLGILQHRLSNDAASEERTTRHELAEINRLRLAAMLAAMRG